MRDNFTASAPHLREVEPRQGNLLRGLAIAGPFGFLCWVLIIFAVYTMFWGAKS